MNFDHISMEIQRKIKFPFSSCITGTGGLGWGGGGREQSSVSVDWWEMGEVFQSTSTKW